MKPLIPALAIAFALTLGAPARAATDPRDDIVESYLVAQNALASDTTDGVANAAAAIERAAAGLPKSDARLRDKLRAEARALAAAKDLPAVREAFKPLSADLVALARGHYHGKRTLAVFNCPMAQASWIQEDAAVRNPYFGRSMLACGSRTGSL